ncbi:MAG: glycosyltransferase family 2 protein [Deltaproteobacteria bacterium]|nr:glycosyltransferase family 2 protein [Deltaproteobacteria bacterium]
MSFRPLIVIPCFNSAHTLSPLLAQLKTKGEVLIVDDGSVDKSSNLAVFHNVKLVRHESNQGLSKAMATAFDFARSEKFSHVVALDSDGQHPPELVPEILRFGENFDLVLGNRFHAISNIPSCKIGANLLASSIFEKLTGIFLSDVACGFRSYRVDRFLNCPFGDDYEFIYRTLLFAIKNRLQIGQVKIPATYFSDQLLATRRTELLSLLSSTSHEFWKDDVVQSRDFVWHLQGIDFHGFYVDAHDSYIIQCDLNSAHEKYHAGN